MKCKDCEIYFCVWKNTPGDCLCETLISNPMQDKIKEQEEKVKKYQREQQLIPAFRCGEYNQEAYICQINILNEQIKLLEMKLEDKTKNETEYIHNIIKNYVDEKDREIKSLKITIDLLKSKLEDYTPQPPKEKTLKDYRLEYAHIKYNLSKHRLDTFSTDSFEFSCGLLKYICGEVDKENSGTCPELRYHITCNINPSIGYIPNSSKLELTFSTRSLKATDKVIRICGSEFLDKIFKA